MRRDEFIVNGMNGLAAGRNNRLTAVVSGYYGFGNAGDEALLEAMLAAWRRVRPHTRFIVLSGDPPATEARHGVEAVVRTDFRAIGNALRGADVFVSGGGSLLQDATSARTVPYYTSVMALARRYRVPVVVYSQGLGPLRRGWLRRMAGKALSRAAVVTVRDQASADEAVALGVPSERIVVTADPVFSWERTRQTPSEQLASLLAQLPREPLLGVSLRPLQGDSSGARTRRWIGRFAGQLRPLVDAHGLRVLPLPLFASEDAEPLQLFADILGQDRIVPWPKPVDSSGFTVHDWLGLFRRLDMCLTMRLHGLIFSAVAKTPFIALADDPKVDAHVAELGLNPGEWIVSAARLEMAFDAPSVSQEEARHTEFTAMFDTLWTKRGVLRDHSFAQLGSLKGRALRAAQIAVSVAERSRPDGNGSEASGPEANGSEGVGSGGQVAVLGTAFDAVTMERAVGMVRACIEGQREEPGMRPAHIVTANPELVMRARTDGAVRDMLSDAELVVADGIGIVGAARLLGTPLPERVPGVDLMEAVLAEAATHRWRVFLLGGEPGVAEKARDNIRIRWPLVDVVGIHHGYFHDGEADAVARVVAAAQPDIVFVGMGAPRQELFIASQRRRSECTVPADPGTSPKGNSAGWGNIPVAIGIGGSIDVLAGRVRRAPKVWQRLGLEWLYRIVRQPSRLRRALVLPRFGMLVLYRALRRNLL